jgi:hypothetical protein
MSRLPRLVDNWLTDDCEVASLTRRMRFVAQEDSCNSLCKQVASCTVHAAFSVRLLMKEKFLMILRRALLP